MKNIENQKSEIAEIDITKDLEPLFIDYFKSKNANQEPNEELMQLLQEIKNA